MPRSQNALIEAVAAVNPNTVVVLQNGSPVEMPWADQVKGIMETYLGGDAIGAATVNILYGKVNPSGRLAESFPKKVEDNPSYLFYIGENDNVEYREGVFVGYRYYETKKCDVLFPFGHGLSYTHFDYSNLRLSHTTLNSETETMSVEVDVTNTGEVEGREVVQLYVAPHKGVILRPIKELKGFTKVNLKPNETKTVTFALDKRSFAYWNLELNDWHVEDGNYDIVIGKNVHDDVLKQTLSVRGITIFVGKLTELSTIGDVILNPKGAAYWEKIQPRVIEGAKQKGFTSETDVENESDHRTEVMFSLPINTLCFIIPDYTIDELNTALEEINKDDWRIY
ncbi:hypothetical protein FE296_26170 [Paenibacillus sp. UASWS1643]|nr:hypothetical protein FE296_26170 [Paenibacillus sp. UASWS1643]